MWSSAFLLLLLVVQVSIAQSLPYSPKNYVPLMQWPSKVPLLVESSQSRSASQSELANSHSARPQIAGQWPKDVELLEDALLRKHGKLLGGSKERARDLIVRRYNRSPQSAAQLRGIFAEAVYVGRTNEGYVRKPNAPHNDVCPLGNYLNCAQIKTKRTFTGSGYDAEMQKDYLAKRFIVPDDHVEPLKQYLIDLARKFQSEGKDKLAANALSRSAKVRPLGETSKGLERRLRSVNYRSVAFKTAPYVSLGTSMGLGLAPIVIDYVNGTMTPQRLINLAARDVSLRMAAIGTDSILANVKSGALRGSLKGNLITGAAMFATDASYLIYENGGRKAFREAVFWEEIGGSASALTLGVAVGAPVSVYVTGLASETGPGALLIGGVAGLVAGSVSSTIGYVGGRAVTKKLLEGVAPEVAHKAERQAITDVRTELNAWEQKVVALN